MFLMGKDPTIKIEYRGQNILAATCYFGGYMIKIKTPEQYAEEAVKEVHMWNDSRDAEVGIARMFKEMHERTILWMKDQVQIQIHSYGASRLQMKAVQDMNTTAFYKKLPSYEELSHGTEDKTKDI
jgi:hypothetical protein